MGHVVLLGDSIFDNARYVPDRPLVVEQVRRGLPAGWKATLVAVDGHTVEDVTAFQMARVPPDSSHLVVSVGGNDALGAGGVLREAVETVGDALAIFGELLAGFRAEYQAMLRAALGLGKPVVVSTVYDAIPILGTAERVGLGGFNAVILRSAVAAGVPVLDL